MGDDLRSASSTRGGDGDTGGHGFEDHVWRALAEGRKHEDACKAKPRRDGGMKAGKHDAVAQFVSRDQRLQTGKLRAFSDENCAPALRPLSAELGEGFDQIRMALFPGKSADREQNGFLWLESEAEGQCF
jgi:hypothetical protein